MTKADQWFHHLFNREKRNIICDYYAECCDCPMFAFQNCSNDNETANFFNKDTEKGDSDEKTESSI